MTTITPDDMPSALGIAGELAEQCLVRGAVDTRLGDQEAGRGRDDQGWDLRDQTVTDGQQRVGLRRIQHGQVFLSHADDDAGDDVDEGDQEAGNGVAADELRGAVHGAVKGRFIFQPAAPVAGLGLIDQTGRQIGVDRHLLAGHGVQGKTRRDFGNSAGAFGDDDEIYDHQYRKDDDADNEIALHHEIAERLNDLAGGIGAGMSFGEDQPGRCQIERKAHHGGDQQDGRKGRELQRLMDEQRRHQDQHREGDRNGQHQVQQCRRHRQDEHHQDDQDADRQSQIGARQDGAQIGQAGERQAAAGKPAAARRLLRPRR